MTKRRDTLLHFLTGMADPISTRQFQRVLAEEGKFSGLREKLDQYYQARKKDNTPVFKKPNEGPFQSVKKGVNDLKEAVLKGKGLDVDPLDLPPEELDRLLRVERSDRDIVNCSVQLLPELFQNATFVITPSSPEETDAKQKEAERIQQILGAFYQEHHLEFDAPSDIKFEPSNFTLTLKSCEAKNAESLLNQIGLRPEKIVEIIEENKTSGEGEVSEDKEESLKLSIPLTDLGFGDDLAEQKRAKDAMRASLKETGRTANTAKLGIENKQAVLQFNGHADTFFRLVRTFAGISDSSIRSLIDNRFSKKYVRE